MVESESDYDALLEDRERPVAIHDLKGRGWQVLWEAGKHGCKVETYLLNEDLDRFLALAREAKDKRTLNNGD
jgi:hypothetical protein